MMLNPGGVMRMSDRSLPDVPRYSAASRVLHWIVAILVFLTWPLGLMIGFVKDEVKLDFYLVHESLGFLILWVLLLRVGVRLYKLAPPIEGPTLERIAAHSVHGLLYLFLIIMPVSGFLATNAHGFPLQWFGLVPIWSPIGKSPDIAPTFSAIHEWSAWIILALVALHMLAVIFHHLIRRDATLYRIL
ncbi:cytochrome b [Agrobacterium cavarae]|uniref:cytochrome b n=1 Tax=Agrobacterium cavarae TaxID=2528239 RepID=UPI002FD96EEF